MNNFFILEDGTEIILTPGEMKIVKKLKELDGLWGKFGERMILFNGDELRIVNNSDGSYFAGRTLLSFGNINGEGGEGGDWR